MQNIKYSLSQLYLLALILPLLWKLGIYLISPDHFIEDNYSWIRFLLICAILFFYYPPIKPKTISLNLLILVSIFLIYNLTIYSFNVFINHYLNKSLKFDYLSSLYNQYSTDGSEEELKAINSDYRMSSKEDMISHQYDQLFTWQAYIKSFAKDAVKYFIVSFSFAKYQMNRYGK